MIETQDLEVYAMEMELMTDSVMANLLQNGMGNIVLLEQGAYVGIYSMDKHKIMTDKIYQGGGTGIFETSRAFFSRYENRGERLALVDGAGQLLTFLVWNQRAERERAYLNKCKEQILRLLDKGYEIIFDNWDEYTAEYIHFLSEREGYDKQIFLSGRNWELDASYGKYRTIEDKSEKDIVVNKEGIFYPTEEKPVHSLMRMKDEYVYKRFYFYLDTYDNSFVSIVNLLFEHGCVPDGFCELHCQRETESFLGKCVEDLESVVEYKDIVIIVPGSKDFDTLKEYVPEEQLAATWELFEVDKELCKNKVFQTWGTKEEVWKLEKEIGIPNIHIPYRNFSEKNDIDGLLLWEVMGNRTPERYKEYIQSVNGNVTLYATSFPYETNYGSSSSLFIRNFQEALDRKKKIILYGKKSHYTNLWLHILQKFDLTFEIVEEEEQEDWYGLPVGSVHELAFCDKDNLLVILNHPYEDLPYTAELLGAYEVSKEKHNCISVYEEVDRVDRGGNMIDICAGPLCELLAKQPIPGYITIGENRDADYKILVVGGSTSDSSFYQYSSWPEELYKILKEEGKDVTIYSGGVAGAVSVQELSKVMRDIRKLKPDMVISFSGYNDAKVMILLAGYVNGAYGSNTVDEKKKFEDWLENEKMMKMIADREKAKFYCFAQPILYFYKNISSYNLLLTKSVRNAGSLDWEWKDKIKKVKHYSWLVDLMDILENNQDVFFDQCHITTEGNHIIAEHVYEHIKDDIR